jgi:hypothetical protein
MPTDLHAIPREVWRVFVDGGGLDRVEPMRYFRPLLTIRLDPSTAQEEADNQRQRFQRLIVELFPLDRVEAFIATLLDARMYPRLQAVDLDAGLVQPLEKMLVHEVEPVQPSFDLEAQRMGGYGKPRLDAAEYGYAVRLLQLRPGLALATLFLRGFLVIWARALLWEASRSSLNAEHAPSFKFFFASWYQSPLISILYPSIALHLRPRIELSGKRIDEPTFTRPLMSEVMSWLTTKGFFAQEAKAEWCGYEARLTCSATRMLHQALGKRGWLNTIFDKVVEDQDIPLMSTYLEQVLVRGNRLAAFSGRARASGAADPSNPLR